jgi:hypothetical protein
MNRAARTIATVMLAVLAMSGGRADDVVVDGARDDAADALPGMVFVGGTGDLLEMFDGQAFANGQGFGMVVMNHQGQAEQPPAADNDAVVAQRLEPVRQRAAAKIATVDKIVGLAEKQRKKLEIAAQSDLRRLTAAVAEARAKYVGRTLQMDPRNGGFGAEGQKAIEEVGQDAQRCRELIGRASGSESLLSKVIIGTLDEPQAAKYKAVMDGRRDCRWKAAVATYLGQLDETLGLTQKQHDALTTALLAAPPIAEELFAGGSAQPQQVALLVANRMAAAIEGDAKLAAALDPRQRAAVSMVVQAGGFEGAVGGGMGFEGLIVE